MKINEIIARSAELEKTMPDRLDDPDWLSHAIAMQGNYRSLLGARLAKLEKESAEQKAFLKFTEANNKKTLLQSSNMAVNKAELEILSDSELQDLRLELIEKEYFVNLLKIKRDDIKTANDGYRSRLAFIREEVK